jgi:hypothetical protein
MKYLKKIIKFNVLNLKQKVVIVIKLYKYCIIKVLLYYKDSIKNIYLDSRGIFVCYIMLDYKYKPHIMLNILRFIFFVYNLKFGLGIETGLPMNINDELTVSRTNNNESTVSRPNNDELTLSRPRGVRTPSPSRVITLPSFDYSNLQRLYEGYSQPSGSSQVNQGSHIEPSNNLQVNYGLYQEPLGGLNVQYRTTNTEAPNATEFYAAKLGDNISYLRGVLTDTPVIIETTQSGYLTQVTENDLVSFTKKYVIVIKNAVSITQHDQKYVLELVKETLHDIDKVRVKINTADYYYSQG